MLYYSKKSKRKVAHLEDCCYISKTDNAFIGKFSCGQHALSNGYRLCEHCFPISRILRKEGAALQTYSQQNRIEFSQIEDYLKISTKLGTWGLIYNAESGILLYHKNIFSKSKYGAVPGFHKQAVKRSTVLDYLKYIASHDAYRKENPLKINNARTPQKGTERWRKKMKTYKNNQKRYQIKRVLNLIDSLKAVQ